jgi:CRP/FNR family transcriptional regulator, cyclic AMP receptor protein
MCGLFHDYVCSATLIFMFGHTYQSEAGPFTAEELDAFAGLAQSKIHPAARSTIMGEGDRTDFCLLIESGLVKVIEAGPRFAGLRGPGDLVGEKGALRRTARTASIVAVTNVEALWIPGNLFRKYCLARADIVLRLWAVDDDRRVEAGRRSSESPISKERRFAELLIDLVTKGHRVETAEGTAIPSPQTELAEFMNLSRESVSPVVRPFKENNVIQVQRGRTVVTDWDLLGAIARGERTISP